MTSRRQWLIALSVTFGTLMGALDGAIVNVALPHIRRAYTVNLEDVTWLSAAYILAAVLVMPLTGFLGRWYGQRRVYLACLALFAVASAACAFAPSFAWLVVLRAVQGFGAGALQPTEQAILRQTFPADKLGTAMGVFNLAVGIGPLTGPTLGGWIVDHVAWTWIFLINVPVGALGLAMVSRFVPRDEPPAEPTARRTLDWLGLALLWPTLFALQYVLEQGRHRGWLASPVIVVLAAVALAGGIAFIRHELTTRAPAVNLRVFREPTYAISTIVNAIAMAIMLSSAFLLPVFLQELVGDSAMHAGMAQFPRTIVMVVVMPIVGRLYNRLPPRASVALGLLIAALGQYWMSRLTLQSTSADAVLPLILQGLGMSVVIIVLSTLSLTRIDKPVLGDAAGLAALLRQIGTSTGLAIMATLLASTGEHAAAVGDAAARAAAFQHTFAIGGELMICLLPLVWFIRPRSA